MTRRAFASLALLTIGSAAMPVQADPPGLKPLAIGAAAPEFRLPGVDGKAYGLGDFADAKVLVVAFTCNHCPTANAYEARFKKFAGEFKPKGVAFVAISPNDPRAVRLDELGYTDLDDSFEAMKIRARDHHSYNYPLPLRWRDAGDLAGVRCPGDATRLHLRRRIGNSATRGASMTGEVKAGQVARCHQRRRGCPGRQAKVEVATTRPARLLDQVG